MYLRRYFAPFAPAPADASRTARAKLGQVIGLRRYFGGRFLGPAVPHQIVSEPIEIDEGSWVEATTG